MPRNCQNKVETLYRRYFSSNKNYSQFYTKEACNVRNVYFSSLLLCSVPGLFVRFIRRMVLFFGKKCDVFWWRCCMQEMRAAFENESVETGQRRLLITAAVAAGKKKIDAGYDVPVLNRYTCMNQWINEWNVFINQSINQVLFQTENVHST